MHTMLLSITTREDDVFSIDVPEDMEVENVKALVAMEVPSLTGNPFDLLWNGKKLSEGKKTLQSYGVADGDMLFAVTAVSLSSTRRPPATRAPNLNPTAPSPSASTSSAGSSAFGLIDFSSIRVPQETRLGDSASRAQATPQQAPPAAVPTLSSGPNSPESVRQQLLSSPEQLAVLRYQNPALFEVVNDEKKFAEVMAAQNKRKEEEIRLRMADPFDVDAQRRIAETIQQSNIDASMEQAIEYMPESFGQVIMLYISVEVNGKPVKAFVDSGAQMTIMSEACARRCHIERLIDRRWAGVAKGVGTQKIVGRVHMGQIKIASAFLPSSFTILVDQEMDLLLGLDMLRRHQCIIDLARNCLIVGSSNVETPFLPESELPNYARLSNQPGSPGGLQRGVEASSLSGDDPLMEEKLNKITAHGFSRENALVELRNAGGDMDKALATLLAKSLSQ